MRAQLSVAGEEEDHTRPGGGLFRQNQNQDRTAPQAPGFRVGFFSGINIWCAARGGEAALCF